MNDLELLEWLLHELIDTLEIRRANPDYYGKYGTKARIRRLRLEIGRLMLRIEKGCVDSGKDKWDT